MAEDQPDSRWTRDLGTALRPFRPGAEVWRLSLLDGPNMSNLGRKTGGGGRDPRTYGTVSSLAALHRAMNSFAKGLGAELSTFESYHEADFLQRIYDTRERVDAFFVNPAALTRFGVPLRIALTESQRPFVELHFSNISAIGWRGGQTTPYAHGIVMGLRQYSYLGAIFGTICALDEGFVVGGRESSC
jgi:3-dehydroquinate dehydratase-2